MENGKTAPQCRCFKQCGGCQLQEPYAAQLQRKQQKAERRALRLSTRSSGCGSLIITATRYRMFTALTAGTASYPASIRHRAGA